jgi:hypothetical protein
MEPSDEIHPMSEPWLQRKAKERVAVAIGFCNDEWLTMTSRSIRRSPTPPTAETKSLAISHDLTLLPQQLPQQSAFAM